MDTIEITEKDIEAAFIAGWSEGRQYLYARDPHGHQMNGYERIALKEAFHIYKYNQDQENRPVESIFESETEEQEEFTPPAFLDQKI